MTEYRGIDISLFQGRPDFAAVKADGVEFVMLKASQGRIAEYDRPFADPEFAENMAAAGTAGLYRGVYHYFCASTEEQTREEAAFFIDTICHHRFGVQLWAAVDVEDGGFIKTDYDATTANVKLFCDLVRAAGYRPMVYANTYWLDTRFAAPAGVPLWEANWGISGIPSRARMWQYTSTGSVAGISGNVDINMAYDIIGDANGDGKVDNRDVADMLRSEAGWKDVAIDESQADLNQDGVVDNRDIALLLRRLAGWRT